MAAAPSLPSLNRKNPTPEEQGNNDTVTYRGFETSAAVIKRTRWQVEITWTPLDEEGARAFIRTPPPRDNRKLMGKSRFRLLLVQYSNKSQLYKQEELLKTAKEHRWINDSFGFLIKNQTGGISVSESTDSISFAIQAPTDDDYPFFSLSLTEQYTDGRRRDADWVCLLFSGPTLPLDTVESLLCKDSFPSDFDPPLSPDLMFLPTSLLRWQVEQTTQGLNAIRKEISVHDNKLNLTKTRDFTDLKTSLYKMRQTHLMLHRRWLLAQDLMTKLNRCFDKVESSSSSDDYAAKYSPTLRYKVQAEAANLTTLLHDLDAAPLRMDAQQTMLDNQTRIILLKNSEMATEEARRDSTSMRTIAIMTLVFLPGTFVAVIFSMSILNWQAKSDQGEHVVSRWIWLYFTITGILTLIVMVIWIVWIRYSDKKYHQEWERKIA